MKHFIKKHLIITGLTLMIPFNLFAQYHMEGLGRGVVAIHKTADSVFISWRVLGTDPDDIAFNLYRKSGNSTVKLNASPITGATVFTDGKANLKTDNAYYVKPILKGKEGRASTPFLVKANSPVRPYLSIPLQTPAGYTTNDASVGDLDGDGEYEIVLHQTGRSRDNSLAGMTDKPILQAYRLDGTLLWTIDLGRNVREGAHYTQFMVYDFDGDGKAEMACKTADGTIDGQGKVIGDSTRDYRNADGFIAGGPEYLTMFNGLTGAAISTTQFIPQRYPGNDSPTLAQQREIWSGPPFNMMDRFLAGVAYLDGVHPSLIMCRGYYSRTVITAWDFQKGKLKMRWSFDSDANAEDRKYRGQGNHNLSIADVDGDGKDEIIYGAMTLDDNGKGLYSTGLGHADALHVSDLDPDRPGLEVFDIQERFADAGVNFRDARTGEILWKKPSLVKDGTKNQGPGRGLALNIDPRYRGFESWAAGAGVHGLYDVKGNVISEKEPSTCNMGIFWDGDLLSEILNGGDIDKWDYMNSKSVRILNSRDYNVASNNGTKSNPCLSADILGDWREELLVRTRDSKELLIFTTTIPTTHRFYTFMHDPQYRESIAWQNVAYNQPPHTSFYIGDDMKPAPKPNIVLIKPKKE